MIRFTPRFAAFLALIPSVLGACTVTRYQPPLANGAEGVLYFSQVTNADLGVVPVGITRRLDVQRIPGGNYECRGLGVGVLNEVPEGDVNLQSGFRPGPGLGECDSVAPDEIEFDSAFCDDAKCTVTTDEDSSGSLELRVSATEAGATRLHVTVKSTSDGSRHSDSISLRFAPAGGIALTGRRSRLPALSMPILPGTPVELPVPSIVDAEGHPMGADGALFTLTLEGDAMLGPDDERAPSPYFPTWLVARTPGRTTARWEVPSIPLSRTVHLEVVDPSAARTLIVLPKDTSAGTDKIDFDAWTKSASAEAPIDTIELTANSPVAGIYPTRVLLADGRRALTRLREVKASTPSALWVSLMDDGAFTLGAPRQVDETSLILRGSPADSANPLLAELVVRVTNAK